MVRLVPFAVLVIFLLLAASCQHQGAQLEGGGVRERPQAPEPVVMDPVTADLGAALETDLFAMFPHLEPGVREVDGIPFLTDGRVRVLPGHTRRIELPATRCASLHFLHFTENSGGQIGSYILHYEDGAQLELPIQGGVTIQDWWLPGPLLFAGVAHLDNYTVGDREQGIGFQRFSARNPHPDVPLTAVEVVNADALATVNLIALTLTGPSGDMVGKTPVWEVGMDEMQFLLAVLKQPGDVAGKATACDQLGRLGSVETVPILAAHLEDKDLSHPARLALASMGYPEAKAALRDALPRTEGTIQAGIIESLGTTRDPRHARLLAPYVNDSDPTIAMSALLALGRIGGPKAIAALETAARERTGRLKAVALDGLLSCAESLAEHNRRAAHALYADIYKEWGEENAGPAAYGGMVRTAQTTAHELIASALMQDDPRLWAVVLPTVRDAEDTAVTRTCAGLLEKAPQAVLPALIGALGQRGDSEASATLASLVSDEDPVVAGAAIEALALAGDGTAVDALVTAAARGDEGRRAAALQTLTQMGADNVCGALLARLKEADAAETAAIAKVLGERKDDAVGPALRELVQSEDEDVRLTALQALAGVGTIADADLLCGVLERAGTAKERAAATRALTMIGNRLQAPPPFVDAVSRALATSNVPVRCAMLDVCGSVANPALLQALNDATADADAAVRDAAIRALAGSTNPDALPLLIAMLETTHERVHRVQVLRGIARLASNSAAFSDAVREAALLKGMEAAERPEERKLLLGALATCPTPGTLGTAAACLASDDVAAEAVVAWGQIAGELVASQRKAIAEGLPQALAAAERMKLSDQALRPVHIVRKKLNAVAVAGHRVQFAHTLIDQQFRAEGVAVADVNRDGLNDFLVGDYWYAAPDWQAREIRPPQTYDGNTGYSRCFATFAEDVDQDGWTDSIVIGFPGTPAYWYRNPGDQSGHWQEFLLATSASGETPVYGDLLGDGDPVLLFAMNSRISWFRAGQDRLAPWQVFPVSHPLDAFTQFGHGLGFGDVNGDGRADVLSVDGYWVAPVDRTRPDWGFQPAALGPACANMLVYDVNGDGLNDIITSSAHEYGVWWFEQRQENGVTTFVQHEICSRVSQTHALILADMNNDGLQDLVTGKRYYAHNGNDPGAEEPAVLCWYELQRTTTGDVAYQMHEIHSDSGVGTQFDVYDVDDDGLLDVVTANKKGVHLFLQRRSN